MVAVKASESDCMRCFKTQCNNSSAFRKANKIEVKANSFSSKGVLLSEMMEENTQQITHWHNLQLRVLPRLTLQKLLFNLTITKTPFYN